MEKSVRMKKITNPKHIPKTEVSKLQKNDEMKQRYAILVENRYEALSDQCDEDDP